MQLDLTRPMQTRHGYPARLVYDQLWDNPYGPLVFAIRHPEGVEKLGIRDDDGRYYDRQADHWDIINAPVPDSMVIVRVKCGMADVSQVPDGIVVKVMDYDVADMDRDDLIVDEEGEKCSVSLWGPAGIYHAWPFA
jgi:hypothetical protein